MCFVNRSSSIDEEKIQQMQNEIKQAKVVRHQADASSTKTNQIEGGKNEQNPNIKTTPLGLEDDAVVTKKTLLGE